MRDLLYEYLLNNAFGLAFEAILLDNEVRDCHAIFVCCRKLPATGDACRRPTGKYNDAQYFFLR